MFTGLSASSIGVASLLIQFDPRMLPSPKLSISTFKALSGDNDSLGSQRLYSFFFLSEFMNSPDLLLILRSELSEPQFLSVPEAGNLTGSFFCVPGRRAPVAQITSTWRVVPPLLRRVSAMPPTCATPLQFEEIRFKSARLCAMPIMMRFGIPLPIRTDGW